MKRDLTDPLRTTAGRSGVQAFSLFICLGLAWGVAVTPAKSAGAQSGLTPDPRIQQLTEEVSPDRLGELVEALVSFETRDTRSRLDDPERGIKAAGEWIREEMAGYSPRLQVELETFRVPPQGRILRSLELRNVKAVLPGRSERRIYVTAHYDSSARLPGQEEWDREQTEFENYAPGANDNGSGTAVVMELARVLAQSSIEFDATLVFVAFAGEEQGLVGARLHAAEARERGLRIDAVYNSDIVGNVRGGSGIVDGSRVRVFSQGPEDSPSRQIARYIRRTGSIYVPGHVVHLVAREDRFGRGGDHSAFNWAGFPGVRFSEPQEDYSRQHTVLDTPDGVSPPYMARNARVKLAALASQAMAPPAPTVLDGDGQPMLQRHPRRGYDARLSWEASPGAHGYRVFWRDTWSMDWKHSIDVGNVTEVTLPEFSLDIHVLGVAAVGPDGHESVVSVYVRPDRIIEPVQISRSDGVGTDELDGFPELHKRAHRARY